MRRNPNVFFLCGRIFQSLFLRSFYPIGVKITTDANRCQETPRVPPSGVERNKLKKGLKRFRVQAGGARRLARAVDRFELA